MSLATITAELAWLQSLFAELHIPILQPPKVLCDNLSVVLLAANPVLHSRKKHFELDFYFVRDKIQKKELQVSHIPSNEKTIDMLTKLVTYIVLLNSGSVIQSP